MTATDIPSDVRNSKWWLLIAAIPVLQILVIAVIVGIFYVVFGLGQTRIFGFGEARIAMAMTGLSLLVLPLMIALPYALYRDIERLDDHGAQAHWDVEQDHYTIAAAVGIFFPIIAFAVALFYLYQRHVHVGVP